MPPFAPAEDLKDQSSSAGDYPVAKDAVKAAVESLHIYDLPLTNPDKVMVMQGWNKVLAFKTAFSESLWLYWRILVATDTTLDTAKQAVQRVERNEDPLAECMLDRATECQDLLMGLIDGAFRTLCPMNQVVQRESYRPIQEDVHIQRVKEDSLTLECESVDDYLRLFARCGVQPEHWVLFCEAFIWCLQTHTPYAKDDDKEDIERGADGSMARAIAQLVALPAIKSFKSMIDLAEIPLYKEAVPRLWARLTPDDRMDFGERFYRTLLSNHPNLLDYFSKTDMDSLAIHFVGSLDLIVTSASELASANGDFRHTLRTLGDLHRMMGVPTYAFALVGATLIECLEVMFEREEELSKNAGTPVTAKQLRGAFIFLYGEVMSMVYYPMYKQEKMVKTAQLFYEQLQAEFHWTDAELSRRMQQVEQEIGATGTYTQTSKELEMGARLAWRNSAKCIGRISWNTLQVRDCRHVSTPAQIFEQVEEHLKIATAGTNIQSVMTVFQPQDPNEPFGTRFWSSQYVRYAAYQDDESGDILGDPANLELTEYLIKRRYWKPPTVRSAFDTLPIVLKVPGRKKPYIHELPKESVFEVDIVHPTRPELSALGYRWTTIPAISNFKMNLGGVLYQNMPFNGWFMSTEIVRNLMERYDAGPAVCNAMGIDMNTDPVWRASASSELEKAVLHSFQKEGYTIVDPHSVGQQFCTHVRREREQFGRECPAQWSWIGGMVGPTNPTWHLEMRDFLVTPQYDYCADSMLLHTSVDQRNDWSMHSMHSAQSGRSSFSDDDAATRRATQRRSNTAPRVLIAYGSETGTAEAVSRRLKRQFKVLNPILMTLNEAKGLDIISRRHITHVICVCSTFGMGNAPSNAAKFFTTTISNMKSTKFAVLALGSTIYPDFCKAGIKLDKQLAESGMERVVNLTTADSAGGADDTIEYWLHLVKNRILPPSLENELMVWQDVLSNEPPRNEFVWHDDEEEEEEKEVEEDDASTTPMGNSLCVGNEELLPTGGKYQRSIRKITFETPEGTTYESGDHISVKPMNSDVMSKRFLKCFEKELVRYAKKDPPAGPSNDETGNSWWKSFVCGDTQESPNEAKDTEGVEAILEDQCSKSFRLDCIEGEEVNPSDVFFEMPTSLFDVIKKHLDLSINSKDVVELLKMLQGCLDQMLDTLGEEEGYAWKHPIVAEFIGLCSPIIEDSSNDKSKYIETMVARFPTMVNFLEHFKDLFLDDFITKNFDIEGKGPALQLAEVLCIMPRLQARYYSVSSSAVTSPDKISITVGVLKTVTSRRVPIEGVCSHFLAGLRPGIDEATICVVKSSFRLPKDKEAPLIMVGAGTGVSPMMGFLEDREVDRDNGELVGEINLFFGCRTQKDFIYKGVITRYEQEDILDLHLGLSRAPDSPKQYVQDCIAGMGHAASELLMNRDTHYYVCGDARMADSCFEACVELLRKHQTMSRVKAVKHLRDMRVEGRWQTDVWGIVSHYEESKKVVEENVKKAAKLWLTHFKSGDQ